MSRVSKKTQAGARVKDDLEPYRRLVDLQKQMIELAQQHEQSRRECEALRVQMAKEIAARLREKSGLHRRLRAALSRLEWFNRKESLPC
jgi:hypothetical protein